MFESGRFVRWCLGLALLLALPVGAAEAPAVGSALPLFLAPACANSAAAAVAAETAELPELTPQALEVSQCTAQQNCPTSGCFIGCSGVSSCTVGPTSVTCDGSTTQCPSCPAPPSGCLDPCCWCECKASGGSNSACNRGCCVDCWPVWTCGGF